MDDGNGFNSSGRQMRRTSSVSKQFEAHDEPKKSNKEFIKLLGSDFSKQLQIPEEFTKNFNGHIPHRFIIENVVTNKYWRVEVEMDGDGRIYFGDGWGDFVAAHFLQVGNVLLFEYEEQSVFQVKIYGSNGCLKTELAESNEDITLRKPTESEEEEEYGEVDAFEYEKTISKKCRQQKTRRLFSSNDEHGIYKKQHTVDKTHTRATKVSITESSIRFSVTFHMRKKYQYSQLILPKTVSIKMKLWSKEKLVLRDEKGCCWPVKLGHKRDGHDIFSLGWKDFLKGNEISPGDTLNFEFISDDLVQVNVTRPSHVEHHFEEPKYPSQASGSLNLNGAHYEPVILTTNDKDVGASITTKKVSSDIKSSFSIMWKDTTSGVYLHIPKAVAEDQNLKNKDSVAVRDPQGKCWELEVRTWSDGRVALTKGWPVFWKGHAITAGDSLTFEFVSDSLIQVTIIRGNPLEHATEGAALTNSGPVHDDNNQGAVDNDEVFAMQIEATDIDKLL